MNLHSAQPGALTHVAAETASGAQLVIENLDVPADQDAVLFTVTYTHSVPATADFLA
ncbi:MULTISPECIES: hypothetical protein [Streptomyces]|jgi:hypothetical protein|uniref:hypothetical protein n=1 Tax=Streptomyces TaxID=1883 RepID=UPI0002DCAA85|nr:MULTISPECIES: hypothetical protein [Streptomyces]MYS45532.1 hypothetical protein [Streptomyces sp. SID5998]MYX42882.1 hypothetical protein [Streptomyces sp. SID89]NED74275.1 hypothetical protein [Streptomyces sp. SID9944]MBY8864153.1 hypothetical protein [Streptomyces sennicomposti]MYX31031.1 hypothetical protein [Streptomyces sp. SID8381]